MANFSQRDARWSSQRLGTVNGITIGGYGCYVTAMADVATHFGKDTNPSELDNWFTDHDSYVDGDLAVDGMLSWRYPDIVFAGTYNCQNEPANLNVFNDFNTYEHEAIIEVDFNHNPNDGIQTHFVRFNSYDPNTGRLMIDDPWYGDEVNFADRYGDPTVTIQKVVKYYGPSLPQAVPAQTAPTPQPESTPTPEVVSTPVSEPVVAVPEVQEGDEGVSNPPSADATSAPSVPPVLDQLPVSVEPSPDDTVPVVLPSAPSLPLVSPNDSVTATVNQAIISLEQRLTNLLSRKFLLSAGTWGVGLMGALSGYLSSGQTVSLLGAVTIAFLFIEGRLDKSNK